MLFITALLFIKLIIYPPERVERQVGISKNYGSSKWSSVANLRAFLVHISYKFSIKDNSSFVGLNFDWLSHFRDTFPKCIWPDVVVLVWLKPYLNYGVIFFRHVSSNSTNFVIVVNRINYKYLLIEMRWNAVIVY